jgi:hypothetical protein
MEHVMSEVPPLIAINHDTHHANHIGHLEDGRQFFLTTPFIPAMATRPRKEFVALYLFDPQGRLLEVMVDELGARSGLDEEKSRQLYDQRLRDLGKIRFERIVVAPFSVAGFGTSFGLVPRPPEQEGQGWSIEMQPGNYMTFFAPFDSGEYDT